MKPAIHQRAVPASTLRFQSKEKISNPPLPSLSIHMDRPNLSNAKEENCSSSWWNLLQWVTFTDPSEEQLASRPSSSFQRRDHTLPNVMRVRRWFCWLIHSITWWLKLCKCPDLNNWWDDEIMIVPSPEQVAKTSAEIQVTSLIWSQWKWKTWSAVFSSESQTMALCHQRNKFTCFHLSNDRLMFTQF